MSVPVLVSAASFQDSPGKYHNDKATGIGKLTDFVEWYVEEERNGSYELEMIYSNHGVHADDIIPFNVIIAKPNYQDDPQPFRIYEVKRTLGGNLEVHARHISYDLDGAIVEKGLGFRHYSEDFKTVISYNNFLTKLRLYFIYNLRTFNLTFSTPSGVHLYDNGSQWSMPKTDTFRSMLGGVEGSLLDVFGGEYKFDWGDVTFYTKGASRGADHGVTIRYGKDLTEFEQQTSIYNLYTHAQGLYTDSDNNEVLADEILATGVTLPGSMRRVRIVDVSQDFQERPTPAQVKSATQAWISKQSTAATTENVTFNYEQISEVAPLINLCDIVHVENPFTNAPYQAKVIRTKWAGHLDHYSEVECGAPKTESFTVSELAEKPNTDKPRAMQEFRTNWGTTLEVFVGYSAIHLSLFVNDKMGFIWIAGASGNMSPNVYDVKGTTGVNVTYSNDTGILTITTPSASTITVYRPYRDIG